VRLGRSESDRGGSKRIFAEGDLVTGEALPLGIGGWDMGWRWWEMEQSVPAIHRQAGEDMADLHGQLERSVSVPLGARRR
jgi:hypothetical protein